MRLLGFSSIFLLPSCIWVSQEQVESQRDSILDSDEDGFDSVEWGGADCDDSDASVNPEAYEEPYDGIDNDCDETSLDDDLDEDGYGHEEDCDDSSAASSPEGVEVCDDADNDCDGEVDEDPTDGSRWYADSDGDSYGDADASMSACTQPSGFVSDSQDCDDTEADVAPDADEYCDGIDNNCDGEVDEDTAVDAPLWYPDTDADGYGDRDLGSPACTQPADTIAQGEDCDDTAAEIRPGLVEEVSNGVDDNCDDIVDQMVLVDVLGSSQVSGPRLASDSGLLALAWVAASHLEDGETLYQSTLSLVFDASDLDTLSVEQRGGGASEEEGTVTAMDFAFAYPYLAWSSIVEIGGGVTEVRMDVQHHVSKISGQVAEAYAGTGLFDDLQMTYSDLRGKLVLAACGVEMPLGLDVLGQAPASILSGQGFTLDARGDSLYSGMTSSSSSFRCDFDALSDTALLSAGDPMELQAFEVDGSDLEASGAPLANLHGVDLELSADSDYAHLALACGSGGCEDSGAGENLLVRSSDDSGDSWSQETYAAASALVDVDVAGTSTGLAYACAVGEGGEAYLISVGVLSGEGISEIGLDTGLGSVEECAVAVTDSDALVVAFRSGDQVAMGFVSGN